MKNHFEKGVGKKRRRRKGVKIEIQKIIIILKVPAPEKIIFWFEGLIK